VRVCGLTVEFGEGKGPRVGEQCVEIVYGVKDCDEVEEGGYKSDRVLRENRFGYVGAWARKLFGEMGYAVSAGNC
jgi:hypothetical protein